MKSDGSAASALEERPCSLSTNRRRGRAGTVPVLRHGRESRGQTFVAAAFVHGRLNTRGCMVIAMQPLSVIEDLTVALRRPLYGRQMRISQKYSLWACGTRCHV